MFSIRTPSVLKCQPHKVRAADMVYKRASVGRERRRVHDPGWCSARCKSGKHSECSSLSCECVCHEIPPEGGGFSWKRLLGIGITAVKAADS